MLEITPKQALRLINHGPLVLITAIGTHGKPSITPLTWITPISQEPALLVIGVHPTRYIHRLIEETREFVVNIPNRQMLDEVRYCGSVSGREIDKFQVTGLTPQSSSHVRVPGIHQCIGWIECQVQGSALLGDHTLFVGKIVAAGVEEDLFDGYWKTDLPAAQTIHHLGGDWFVSPGRRYAPE